MHRLLAKYEEILRLRRAGAGLPRVLARAAMVALAAEFPGALRELDALPMGEIEARIAALRETCEGAPAAPWMRVLASYHWHLRGALALKRALAARKPAAELPAEATEWLADAARVRAPPGGRLSRLAVSRVAEELDMPEAAVRAALRLRVAAP